MGSTCSCSRGRLCSWCRLWDSRHGRVPKALQCTRHIGHCKHSTLQYGPAALAHACHVVGKQRPHMANCALCPPLILSLHSIYKHACASPVFTVVLRPGC